MFFGKAIAAFKEMAIAYRYGVSEIVDIYVFAFMVVTWLPTIAVGILQAILVPLLNKLDVEQRKDFLAELCGALLVLSLVVFLAIEFFIIGLIPRISHGFSESAQQSLVVVVRLMAPASIAMFFTALFSAELLSREKHANTLFEAIPPLILSLIHI